MVVCDPASSVCKCMIFMRLAFHGVWPRNRKTGRFSPCATLSSSTPGQGFWFLHEVAWGQLVAFIYVAHSPTYVASDGAGDAGEVVHCTQAFAVAAFCVSNQVDAWHNWHSKQAMDHLIQAKSN
jgi:hypothetical protein